MFFAIVCVCGRFFANPITFIHSLLLKLSTRLFFLLVRCHPVHYLTTLFHKGPAKKARPVKAGSIENIKPSPELYA